MNLFDNNSGDCILCLLIMYLYESGVLKRPECILFCCCSFVVDNSVESEINIQTVNSELTSWLVHMF